MNKADSQRFSHILLSLGLPPAASWEEANIIILNSCAVRQSAEVRVQSKLGSLHRWREQGPCRYILLAGCMVDDNREARRRQYPMVDAFVPAGDTVSLGEAVRTLVPGLGDATTGLMGARDTASGPCRWIPIIYGCNQFCSYCIVPYRRGPERSRPLEEIVPEVEGLVSEGVREVTLLGQNVDAYGLDLPARPDLARLLRVLNNVSGLERIRFLTSHPRHITGRLIDAMATLPKVCQHLNLPVQSGDDDILRAMRRGYTTEDYRRLLQRIRQAAPEISLSTDVIVGFPGENEQQFQNTYDLLAEERFDVVHVAMYSPRPGAMAATLPDDIPATEKKRRLMMVEALQEQISREINQSLVGTEVEVLVESHKGGRWFGRTRHDKLVFFPAAGDWVGWLGPIQITSSSAWSLQGEVAQEGKRLEDEAKRELCFS